MIVSRGLTKKRHLCVILKQWRTMKHSAPANERILKDLNILFYFIDFADRVSFYTFSDFDVLKLKIIICIMGFREKIRTRKGRKFNIKFNKT